MAMDYYFIANRLTGSSWALVFWDLFWGVCFVYPSLTWAWRLESTTLFSDSSFHVLPTFSSQKSLHSDDKAGIGVGRGEERWLCHKLFLSQNSLVCRQSSLNLEF